MADLKVKLMIQDIEKFQDIIKLLSIMMKDERISLEIREVYASQFNSIFQIK